CCCSQIIKNKGWVSLGESADGRMSGECKPAWLLESSSQTLEGAANQNSVYFAVGHLAPILYRKPDAKKIRGVNKLDANTSQVVSFVSNPHNTKMRPVLTIAEAQLQDVINLDFMNG